MLSKFRIRRIQHTGEFQLHDEGHSNAMGFYRTWTEALKHLTVVHNHEKGRHGKGKPTDEMIENCIICFETWMTWESMLKHMATKHADGSECPGEMTCFDEEEM